MEYKQIRFKADVLDEEQGIFEGYASVFGNLDSGGDIVDPGAFARTLEENFDRIKILALHNDQLLPVGKPLELREDDKAVYQGQDQRHQPWEGRQGFAEGRRPE